MSTPTPFTETTATPTHAPVHVAETVRSPRTRWGAIIWGALFAAVAAAAFWLIADDERRAGIADWILALTPTTITTLMILTIGVLLLVTGAVALLRRGQHRMSGAADRPSGEPAAD
ncbi:hypothetical protein [Microbacterium sp. W4I20]|uniref:hypothetical protein n=1 Tax=Microbacterium sp. W4I20 TaxID=3042262 RepID=UPI0027811993|nr:hypothetical protein [Microbacterium sp. W4I20]MDQ0728390.1 xanthine/uracil permease [Microbacterium sp. W4I20]